MCTIVECTLLFVLKFRHAPPLRPHLISAGIVQTISSPACRAHARSPRSWERERGREQNRAGQLCAVVRAERVVVIRVRVVALVQEALLRLVRAGGGGVEAELVAVLALLIELLAVAADDDNDV